MLNRMSAYFLDILQGITTLKIFDRSRAQIKVISVVSDRYRNTTLGILRVTFLSALVLEMVSTLSTAIVAVEIGLRLLTGQFSFEQAFFVLLLAPEFYLPLRMLGMRFHAGMTGIEAASSIFDILETKKSIPDFKVVSESESRSASHNKTTKFSIIRFEDVHCIYSDHRAALNGISFDINHGETVALVGPSGSGKSTIAQLLLRFLEPTMGQVTIDGYPLSQISIDEWRNSLSWVPQSPYLFNDTIEANIGLARPNASIDDVIQAASLAYAHNFIKKLPDAYNTIIGERGMFLSGGQAQRIALARAFLKDAPLLILDEATAHLDPELASQIQKSITHLMKGRTTLLIAHSLFTLTHADKICVLKSGRLLEAGTHKTLYHQKGLYNNLISAAGLKP
jgi:ATP-binding cassette subfamily C protein CydD